MTASHSVIAADYVTALYERERARCVVLEMFCSMLFAAFSFACTAADLVTTPEMLPRLWGMFDDAGRGFRHTEQAAFVVATGGGRLALVRWPDAGEPDTVRWYGRFPAGVMAIVHTHPNWQPLPSNIDIRTAQQAHLPVYVVTATEISKTAGGPAEIVLNGDWKPVQVDNAVHEIDASGLPRR
jgi:JAB domain-containing protein similar to deubiquitination enzymes